MKDQIISAIFCLIFAAQSAAELVAIACEQNSLKMSCRKDEFDTSRGVIIIQRAIYGREDSKTCRPANDIRAYMYDPGRCQTLIDMTAVVRYHCQFQPSCQFDVNEVPFDFDCPDVVAYLRVSYNCLPLIGDLPRAAPTATSPPPTTPLTKTTTTTTTTTTTSTPSTTQRSTTSGSKQKFPPPSFSSQGKSAHGNTASSIAQSIISEALAESAPPQGMEAPAEKSLANTSPAVPKVTQHPITSPNDLFTGWGTCPECDFCIERSGRLKCFFVLHNMTWPEAKQGCADAGGELATIRSEIESRFLNRTKYILGIHNTNAWIGLRWKQSAWLWVDDVALDWELSYSIFAPGEPDNWNGWESCVEFVAANIYGNLLGFYSGYWNDQECLLRRDALCQKYWILA